MDKLKPCPFCGSAKVDLFETFGQTMSNCNTKLEKDKAGNGAFNVECINCGAQGSVQIGKQQAAAAWNNRTGSSAPVNTEMLAIITNLAKSDNYAQLKELRENARKLIQQKGRKI